MPPEVLAAGPIIQPKLNDIPKNRDFRGTWIFSIALLLTGIASALEGFYFAASSGLLFGDYVCFGGLSCEIEYHHLRSVFWQGVYLLLFGVGLLIVGGLLLAMIRKWSIAEGKRRSVFGKHSLQKRLAIACALLVLITSVAFLAPVIPFNATFATQPTYPRVSVCYQNVQTVNFPIYHYTGYESISRSFLGAGNYVYVECTVISGK